MSLQRIKKGLWAEQLVAQLLSAKKYQILAANLKTPFAQIDLLVQSGPQKIQIIEVKYLSSWMDPEVRLSDRQRQRLVRAQQYFCAKYNFPVSLYLALVSPEGRCQFVEI